MRAGWTCWRDATFWVAGSLYLVNRWGIKPRVEARFWHDHFNDLLLIPAALPLVLMAHGWLGWRKAGGTPHWSETLAHLMIWSVFCEWVGPRWLGSGTGDPWDAVCYAVGAGTAQLWWNRKPHELALPRVAASPS